MLSETELRELEASLLPALERHHLRLLAHSLRTLQRIGEGGGGALPTPEEISLWAHGQPTLTEDPEFCEIFLDQLSNAGSQLAAIAEPLGLPPLCLSLSHLVSWARDRADQRLSRPASEPGSPEAIPPPG